MAQRWPVLMLLFVVRLSMAFQFQSVASVSPAMMTRYGVGLGDMGLLISLYLAPGLAFALPGGEIGRRFGDKRVILFGLALMIAGGLVMAFAPDWRWQLLGRIVAGTGGVLLNVLMSKMVTDWFAGKELATAMAIFVNSWPAGIALCLFVLPAVAATHGIAAAFLLSTAFCGIGFILLAALYKAAPPTGSGRPVAQASWPQASAVRAVVVAGCIWGLFNAAISMVFSFGPAMLAERGWSLAAAGSATSLVLWIISVASPVGGFISDRTGKPIAVMLTGFVLFAVTLVAAARVDAVIATFVILGLVAGIAVGPIMSLPARVLGPSVRAVGMGLFFTLFYAFVVVAPIAAGMLATRLGSASAAFDLGAAMLLLCVPAYWLFDRLAARAAVSSPR